MDEDWRNAFGILMCAEICDGTLLTCSSYIFMEIKKKKKYLSGTSSSEATKEFLPLTLLLLNTTGPVLANSVDPGQLASEEAN